MFPVWSTKVCPFAAPRTARVAGSDAALNRPVSTQFGNTWSFASDTPFAHDVVQKALADDSNSVGSGVDKTLEAPGETESAALVHHADR